MLQASTGPFVLWRPGLSTLSLTEVLSFGDIASLFSPARATVSIGVEQDQLKIVKLQDAPAFNEGDEGPTT